MNNFLHKTVIAALALLGATSGFAQSPAAPERALTLEEGVAAHPGLDGVYARFTEGYKNLDPSAVANLYSENAAYLAPGNEVQIGREKIRAVFASFFDGAKKEKGQVHIAFQIVQRQLDTNLATDVGIYTLTETKADGQVRQSRGKFFVAALKDRGGVWRFQVDGYNSLPKPK